MAATIAHGATKTFKLLNAAGKPVLAKKILLRILSDDVSAPISTAVFYRVDNDTNATAIDVDKDMPLFARENLLTIDFNTGQIMFYNSDAANAAKVHIDAYGYEDISGSTFA
jgi:hypothetical protein